MTLMRRVLVGLVCLLVPAALLAQAPSDGYHSSQALQSALKELSGKAVQVSSAGTSAGNLPLPVIRLGAGASVDERPALFLIANAWGPHVVGSEVALRVARRLSTAYGHDSAATALLDRATIYILPRANPDAAEAFFQSPLNERVRNSSAYDDDRDAATDEDGPEDLNGDGIISMMRVRDPAGDWIADSAEPALMRKADEAKGERGEYRMYVEGRDNDGDEAWQEDPPGGVDIGRSFPYGYEPFAEAAGPYMMSEPESRAVAQFIVDHPNIAVIYVLGPQDNLLKAWEGKALPSEGPSPGTSSGGPLKAILKEDEPWFTEVASRFRKLTGLEKGPASAALEGDPLSWGYFDMGRWSFGSRVWWVPEEKPTAAADSARSDSAGGSGMHAAPTGRAPIRRSTPDSAAAQRNAIKWLRANEPGAVLDWKPFKHPDFPDRQVEIGGIRPFAEVNPPASMLDSITTGQTAFVEALAGMLPSLSLRNVKTEALGSGLFRVTAQVANDGYLPTISRLGERVDMPRRVRVALEVGEGRTLVSGRHFQLLDAIPGSGAGTELTWVVRGAAGDRVTLTAESPAAGHVTQSITLR